MPLFLPEHFPDRYYLELIRTGRADEEAYLHAAVQLAEERGIPVVATNDVRFRKPVISMRMRSASRFMTALPGRSEAPAQILAAAIYAQRR